MRWSAVLLPLLPLAVLWPASAAAQLPPGSELGAEAEREPIEDEAAVPEGAPPPAPYSLPWHLRGIIAVNAVRADTTVAVQDAATTAVSFVSASLKVAPDAAIGARYGWVHDAPNAESARSAFTNVAFSGTYGPALSKAFRAAVSGGAVLPVAQGSGGAPEPGRQKAIAAGAYARSAMDNAMFAANDLSFFAGAAFAYVEGGWTLQLETTFFQLIRVEGAAKQPDEMKTNSTWGVHAGYFLVPQLSVSAELRYQAFIAPPRAVQKDHSRRDTATAAIGLRGNVKVGSHAFRPGVAYAHPIDDPMAAAGYRIVQLDLPFVF